MPKLLLLLGLLLKSHARVILGSCVAQRAWTLECNELYLDIKVTLEQVCLKVHCELLNTRALTHCIVLYCVVLGVLIITIIYPFNALKLCQGTSVRGTMLYYKFQIHAG